MMPILLVLAVLLALPATSSAEVDPEAATGGPELAAPGAPGRPANEEGGPVLEEQIVWAGGGESRTAYFLPQRVLDELVLEALPIREEHGDLLRQAFRPDGAPRWPASDESEPSLGAEVEAEPECYSASRGFRCSFGDDRRRARKLRALVRDLDLTFLGRVVAIVPGLLPSGPDAADMTYLEVVSILRDEAGKLEAGRVLGFVQVGGRVIVGGLPLCSDPLDRVEEPRLGDHWLVGGRLHPEAEGVIASFFLLPVEDGMIQPSAYANVLDQLPMPLSELEASLDPRTPAGAAPAAEDLHSAPPASGDPAFAEQILWSDASPREALFLPKTFVESTPPEKLPLPDYAKESLLRQVGLTEPPAWLHYPSLRRFERQYWVPAQRARHDEPVRDCEVPRRDFRERTIDPGGWPEPLLRRVEAANLTFLGEVVAVVPGWSGAPVEMVYLRVEAILQDRRGELQVGAIVHRTRRAGEVVIAGQRLCSERDPWEIVSRPGETVLIGGTLSQDSANQLQDRFEFLVRDGAIQPRPASAVTDRLPMPLARLLEQYRRDPFPPPERAAE